MVDGRDYHIPYYYDPNLLLGEIPKKIDLPDDLHRSHNHYNVINTGEELDWITLGVERRLREIRSRGEDMFIVGNTMLPEETQLAVVYTAPPKGEVV